MGYNHSYSGSEKTNTNLSVYIVTNDGYSAKLFYNPKCTRNESGSCLDDACINVIYDMNGTKPPNHVSEDIGFVTIFFKGFKTSAASPRLIPYTINKSLYDEGHKPWLDASLACSTLGTNKTPYTLPNFFELSSAALNWYLSSMPGQYLWGSPVPGKSGYAYHVSGMSTYGPFIMTHKTAQIHAWCVRR